MKKTLIISLSLGLSLAACGQQIEEPIDDNQEVNIQVIEPKNDDTNTEIVKTGHWNGADCEKGWYGEDCNSQCDCLHGECNDGVLGDGFCNCDTNWSGEQCDAATERNRCVWSDNELLGGDSVRCYQYANINNHIWERTFRYKNTSKDILQLKNKEEITEEAIFLNEDSNWRIPTYEDWQELLEFVNNKYQEYGAENVFEALVNREDGNWGKDILYSAHKIDVFGFRANTSAYDNGYKAYFWGYNINQEQPYSVLIIDGDTKEVSLTNDIDTIDNILEHCSTCIQRKKISDFQVFGEIISEVEGTIIQYL
jgi:uncharacterized protein (TIGR02145 family)